MNDFGALSASVATSVAQESSEANWIRCHSLSIVPPADQNYNDCSYTLQAPPVNDFGALSASVATSVARESSEVKLDPVSQAIYDNMMGPPDSAKNNGINNGLSSIFQAPPVNDFGALSASVATSVARESSEQKLDPVSQAIYDNMMGKLPKKRKLEIPCTACDMIFNSEVRWRH